MGVCSVGLHAAYEHTCQTIPFLTPVGIRQVVGWGAYTYETPFDWLVFFGAALVCFWSCCCYLVLEGDLILPYLYFTLLTLQLHALINKMSE